MDRSRQRGKVIVATYEHACPQFWHRNGGYQLKSSESSGRRQWNVAPSCPLLSGPPS